MEQQTLSFVDPVTYTPPSSRGRTLTFEGQTLTFRQWAEKLGTVAQTLHSRLRRMPLERALTMPVQPRRGGPRCTRTPPPPIDPDVRARLLDALVGADQRLREALQLVTDARNRLLNAGA